MANKSIVINNQVFMSWDNNKILIILLFCITIIFSRISHAATPEEQVFDNCIQSCLENGSSTSDCKRYCQCSMQKIHSHSNSQVRHMFSKLHNLKKPNGKTYFVILLLSVKLKP